MQASHDPKGLIRESYRIDGITDAECRAILIDWALSLPEDTDPRAASAAMLTLHGAEAPAHPMTALLRAGLDDPPARTGRGRRRGM